MKRTYLTLPISWDRMNTASVIVIKMICHKFLHQHCSQYCSAKYCKPAVTHAMKDFVQSQSNESYRFQISSVLLVLGLINALLNSSGEVQQVSYKLEPVLSHCAKTLGNLCTQFKRVRVRFGLQVTLPLGLVLDQGLGLGLGVRLGVGVGVRVRVRVRLGYVRGQGQVSGQDQVTKGQALDLGFLLPHSQSTT